MPQNAILTVRDPVPSLFQSAAATFAHRHRDPTPPFVAAAAQIVRDRTDGAAHYFYLRSPDAFWQVPAANTGLLDLGPDTMEASDWVLTRTDGPIHNETLPVASGA